jgi:hypothetical protein
MPDINSYLSEITLYINSVKQTLLDLNREIGSNAKIVNDSNVPLFIQNKNSKETLELNYTINQNDL